MATPIPINLWSILSESKRIINAHSRHFLALSVIFLLPLSFSLIVSPTLLSLSLSPSSSSPHNIHILLRTTNLPSPPHHHHHHHPPDPNHNHHHHHPNHLHLLLPLSFSLFLLLLSLFSLSSITHSTLHGFFGRPVKLPSALKSIIPSFVPLLLTTLLSHLILLLITTLFTLSFHLLTQTLHLTPSPLRITLFFLPLIFLLLYIRLSWTLAPVVAVVESSYGLKPLKRSANLMKGMKGVGFSSLLFFGLMEWVLVWSGLVLTMTNGDDGTASGSGLLFKDWTSVVHIVSASTLLMLLMLYHTAVDTVLYMYCKAVNGELAVEIVEEFAREYVSLPFDEGKVPHVVSVVLV